MSNQIITTAEELAAIVTQAVEQARATAPLPRLYKFPEDICAIMGGHVQPQTVRWWKSQGWIRTKKIGRNSFVEPEEWERFKRDNAVMMAASPRNRGARLGGGKDECATATPRRQPRSSQAVPGSPA
ncbi:MAG: hypothetical protein OEV73_00345 [Desulfobulbaceae bacterium]|nr:hypothetical protein [Desulfobulbaceae bacterium]